MRSRLLVAMLCVSGLWLLASPALGQPRPRPGPEDGPKAVSEQPTAREQMLEREVRQLQEQLKQLQDALARLQPKPDARPQGAERDRREPAGVPGGKERSYGPAEPGFRSGPGDRDGMPRALPGRPGPQDIRDRQGEGSPPVDRRPSLGHGEQARDAGPCDGAAEVRRLLDEARALISRAEQLLAAPGPQGPPCDADEGRGPAGPGRGRDGRDGQFQPGGRERGMPLGPPPGMDRSDDRSGPPGPPPAIGGERMRRDGMRAPMPPGDRHGPGGIERGFRPRGPGRMPGGPDGRFGPDGRDGMDHDGPPAPPGPRG